MDIGARAYEQFLAGDEEQMTIIVEHYGNPLLLFINSYVHNYHTAEDLMEDCFVELLLKKPNFRGESQFKTYLFQIGRNKALNFLKRSKHFTWVNADDVAHELWEEDTVFKRIEADETKRQLHDALKTLPDHYRQAVMLIYFEEFNYEEAAEVMDVSVKQIDNYIYRAKKKLAQELDRGEVLE